MGYLTQRPDHLLQFCEKRGIKLVDETSCMISNGTLPNDEFGNTFILDAWVRDRLAQLGRLVAIQTHEDLEFDENGIQLIREETGCLDHEDDSRGWIAFAVQHYGEELVPPRKLRRGRPELYLASIARLIIKSMAKRGSVFDECKGQNFRIRNSRGAIRWALKNNFFEGTELGELFVRKVDASTSYTETESVAVRRIEKRLQDSADLAKQILQGNEVIYEALDPFIFDSDGSLRKDTAKLLRQLLFSG